MVLEIKVPHGSDLSSLIPLIPVFLSYILSFLYAGIYWNNNHHMMHTIKRANGKILLANLHLLFWLSLIPFTSGWMGENHFAATPTALYGVVLMMSALAYSVLQAVILRNEPKDCLLAKAVERDIKGKLSLVLYGLAIALCYFNEGISQLIYSLVALMWLIPDRRIELLLFR